MKSLINLIGIFFFCLNSIVAQDEFEQYQYKRRIIKVDESWQSIVLPNEMIHKLNRDFSDIRIVGISDKDSINVPFIIQELKDLDESVFVDFEMLNIVHNSQGYFYTFKVVNPASINQIHLDFKLENFDYQLRLAGSQNQSEWFTILDNYRILSLSTSNLKYQFTQLNFSDADFKYYRIQIIAQEDPQLTTAKLFAKQYIEAAKAYYEPLNVVYDRDSRNRKSVLSFELAYPFYINQIDLLMTLPDDFFRTIQVKYLHDSISTAKGIKYNYKTIYDGTITSFKNNPIQFQNVLTNKFEIHIDNKDNPPLNLKSIKIAGPLYQLIARFPEKADFYLIYGNKNARPPDFDLKYFQEKIPKNLSNFSLGKEMSIAGAKESDRAEGKLDIIWLWIILIFTSSLLSFLTFKMIKKKSKEA